MGREGFLILENPLRHPRVVISWVDVIDLAGSNYAKVDRCCQSASFRMSSVPGFSPHHGGTNFSFGMVIVQRNLNVCGTNGEAFIVV